MSLAKTLLLAIGTTVLGLVGNFVLFFLAVVFVPGNLISFVIVVILVFVLNYFVSRFLKKKFKTPIFGLILLVTIFLCLYIIIMSSITHNSGYSLPYGIALFAFCLIIFHVVIYNYFKHSTSNVTKKTILASLLIVTPVLSLLLPQLFPDSLVKQPRQSNPNTSIYQVMNNFRAQADIYYNENDFSYESLCRGENLLLLINHLKQSTSEVVCIDSEPNYAIEVKLVPLDEQVWRYVDSSGYVANNQKSVLNTQTMLCDS